MTRASKGHNALITQELELLGREKARNMTALEIHNSIYDRTEISVTTSTIHSVRRKWLGGPPKSRGGRLGNGSSFNRF